MSTTALNTLEALEANVDWKQSDLSRCILEAIPQFQWFTHVDFGYGVIAQSTSWPDAPLDSTHMGVTKFEHIIKRNLPNLQGRRILELGCNAGLVSIHMCRLGAREVIGIDSERTWPKWKEQAEFVRRALELRCGSRYNTVYHDLDMKSVPDRDFGEFDAVIALNCLYYLEEEDIGRVMRHASEIAETFVVQCNTSDHTSRLGKRPRPEFMADMLRRNGFAKVSVDWPWGEPRKKIIPRRYWRPVVVGRKG